MADIDLRVSIASAVTIAAGLFLLWVESAWLCDRLWDFTLWLSTIAVRLGETLLWIGAVILRLLDAAVRFAAVALRIFIGITGIAMVTLGVCLLWACLLAPIVRALRSLFRRAGVPFTP